jgi:hypothetical protein
MKAKKEKILYHFKSYSYLPNVSFKVWYCLFDLFAYPVLLKISIEAIPMLLAQAFLAYNHLIR